MTVEGTISELRDAARAWRTEREPLTSDELLDRAADDLEERLRVNVGLVAEITALKRRLRELENG